MIIFLIILLTALPVHASTWPTSNVCTIKAEVTDLTKRWVADAAPDLGVYIKLNLKILEVGQMVRKYSDARSCDEAFKVGAEIAAGEYETNLLGNVQTLQPGAKIRGAIVSYVKSGAIRPHYVFQVTEKNSPLIEVLSD